LNSENDPPPKFAVEVKEGKLSITVPGQPIYPLEPTGGRRYKLGGLEGFCATFRPAKDNPQETEMYLEQPQGNYTLKKVKAADAATASASGASADYAGPLKELDEARIASDFYAPLNWKRHFQKAEIKKMAKVGEEDAYVVVFTPEKGNPVTQYISAKTFLPLRQDTLATSDAMSLPVTETYTDYRSVDGVMIPFRRVQSSQSMGDTVLKIREAAFDVPVPEEVFRRKTAAK
jgi:hypothetical protein